MADVDITEKDAVDAIVAMALSPDFKLDWFEISPAPCTRYDDLGRVTRKQASHWIIRSSIKLGKAWKNPGGSAPLLRQALEQWKSEVTHLVSMQTKFVDAKGGGA